MAMIGLKNSASRNSAATVSAVSPVRPPCSTPAALSMKLVTVLVPEAAPATVPTASETQRLLGPRQPVVPDEARPARATPISVPSVSNSTMNRKIEDERHHRERERAAQVHLARSVGLERRRRGDDAARRSRTASSSIEFGDQRRAGDGRAQVRQRQLERHGQQRRRPECPTGSSRAPGGRAARPSTSRPTKNTIRSGEAKCGFSFTAVPGSLTISPAFCRPMKAMNSPMPMAMPFFMLGLMASISVSRTPTSDSSRNSTPEKKTTPRPICQGIGRSPPRRRAGIGR